MSKIEPNITQLVNSWKDGDNSALDELIPLIFNELRRRAHWSLGHGYGSGRTLQPTLLVSEFIETLLKKNNAKSKMGWQNRNQFFAFAGKCMRNRVIDYFRELETQKRGGHYHRYFDVDLENLSEDKAYHEDLRDALDALEKNDPLASQIVNLRFYCGLTTKQISEVLEIPFSRVRTKWSFARAWLLRYLSGGFE